VWNLEHSALYNAENWQTVEKTVAFFRKKNSIHWYMRNYIPGRCYKTGRRNQTAHYHRSHKEYNYEALTISIQRHSLLADNNYEALTISIQRHSLLADNNYEALTISIQRHSLLADNNYEALTISIQRHSLLADNNYEALTISIQRHSLLYSWTWLQDRQKKPEGTLPQISQRTQLWSSNNFHTETLSTRW